MIALDAPPTVKTNGKRGITAPFAVSYLWNRPDLIGINARPSFQNARMLHQAPLSRRRSLVHDRS
jgi:hypothetical protein